MYAIVVGPTTSETWASTARLVIQAGVHGIGFDTRWFDVDMNTLYPISVWIVGIALAVNKHDDRFLWDECTHARTHTV